MTFIEAYQQLNNAQKQAVDIIDGPVLVIAGPGTGKTQLLATRAANILIKDPTLLPTNILCLTFTDAGQVAMQRRLIELMGEAGAHIAVHTFHSFGAEIINTHPEYFYLGATYSPADELTTHEILLDILKNLPYRSPLASQNQGEYVYLKKIRARIQELKKAALTPGQLRELAMDNLLFVDYIEPYLIDLFDVPRFVKASDITRAQEVLKQAVNYKQPKIEIGSINPLSEVFIDSFGLAIENALAINKPKPINDWKYDWFKRDEAKRPVCKQRDITDKLLNLADVYQDYQTALEVRKLYDFDDMIVRVVQALETRGDLAYELQEQYQYFLVDEFQDTNAGQLRMLNALANHPVNEGRPNVLVVGDDDQAIYAFQGAKLNNILGFKTSYKDVKMVTLTDNYRSTKDILQISRNLILQGKDRLETHYKDINKTLNAVTKPKVNAKTERQLFTLQAHEFEWIASEIKNLIGSSHDPKEIAVICREHKHLEALLPYLYDANIPVAYEKRQNALDNREVNELIVLARVINALANQDEDQANAYLPELLSADYWQIPATAIWDLSLASRKAYEASHNITFWLELMISGEHGEQLKNIGEFLINTAKLCRTLSLEEILDILIGNNTGAIANDSDDEPNAVARPITQNFTSPFKTYYFANDILLLKPDQFITLLSCLSAIRNHLRNYRADTKLKLNDFIYFIDLCREAKVHISVTGLHATAENAVQLKSAHSCKGLEFETVFILSAVNKVWDNKGWGNNIVLSPNMLNIAHDSNPDDNLRIFYVAATRAKNRLIITSYLEGDDGKEVTGFGALEDPSVQAILSPPRAPIIMPDSASSRLTRAERQWFDKHWQIPKSTMRELLANRLETYKLSATHLNNFLDVTNGGPVNFFMGNLLMFPSAMSASSAYGNAIHQTLEFLHHYFIKNTRLPDMASLISYFETDLRLKRLNDKDEKLFLDRGKLAIETFVNKCGETINANQTPEQNFYSQGAKCGQANLTGKLDVLEINKKEARVTDYKTGKALASWGDKGKNNYEKIKMHKYYQQLNFYKLLVDNSRSWGDKGIRLKTAELVFVEPDKQNHINRLSLDFSDSEAQEKFKLLVNAVWQRIINLDFPDISEYEQTVEGIRKFENFLIENN